MLLPTRFFPFLWHFLRPYKRVVVVYVICSVCAGFWGPFNSILTKKIINLLASIQPNNIAQLTFPAICIVLNFIVFDNLTWRGVNYIGAKYVPRLQNQIIARMLDYALLHAYSFYHNRLSGQIAKQITNLSDSIGKMTTLTFANFLRGISLLFTAFVTAYCVNIVFAIILFIWFLCFASASIWGSQRLVVLADTAAAAETVVVGELVDTLANHNNVRIFSRRIYENLRMLPFFSRQQKSYARMHLYATLLACVQGILIAGMLAVSLASLLHLYSKGLLTIGDFSLILSLSIKTGHMMWLTMYQVDELNKAIGNCKQSLLSLILPCEITDQAGASVLQCKRGTITFKQLSFQYAGAEPLFQNHCLEIPAGQKVGLVGHSGSGKSTFVQLILRFYEASSGSILIDEQDILTVTQESLRANIAMIPQDPSLFHRSLMENIRYGRIESSDAAVIAAAKQAHAHEFIMQLTDGYQTLVGERGIKLSGGQRQLVAIARAILKNAPILILDEATSQLDSVTEKLIQESLWQLMQNRTTIVIAHRLSTLLQMDRILVFDNGRIVEDGSHAYLLAQGGLYKQLWQAQSGDFLVD
jgi:ATP-binding cassette subfamily B protein